MKRYFNSLLISCLGCVATQAAIVDQGSITVDTQTGLAWLDVTETTNLSYDDVQTLTAGGGSLAGWRYATIAEFETLLDNIGLDYLHQDDCSGEPRNYCGHWDEADIAPGLQEAVLLLGDTLAFGLNMTGNTSVSVDPNGAGYTYGYLGSPVSASLWPSGNADFGMWIGALTDGEYLYSNGFSYDSIDFINSNYSVYNNGIPFNVGATASHYIGHYLVRPVPVPAAIFLFVGAVGLLRLFGRNSKSM